MQHSYFDLRFWISLAALGTIIATGIWAQEGKAIKMRSDNESAVSNSPTESDIDRLTRESNWRRKSVDSWDTWNIRVLFIAGLAAVFLVITAIGVSRSNRALIAVTDELGRAKDRKLQSDLSLKDVAIAQAQDEASLANKATEELRAKNLELQNKVAWRTFEPDQRKEFVGKLSPFHGHLADCSFLAGDMEAFSFSAEIAAALRSAGWEVMPPNPNILEFKETYPPTIDSPIEKIDFGVAVAATPDSDSTSAAHAIATELNRLGFNAVYDLPPKIRTGDKSG